MTDDLIFITSPSNVLHGDAARVALSTTNDAAYHTEGKGVLVVPLERWQLAQQYERETWLSGGGMKATEDRNTEHANCFNGYDALPGNIGHVIELGCGAFTNVHQIIIRGHTAGSITLLDPLAKEYRASHPHCVYRDGGEIDNTRYPIFVQGFTVEDYETDDKFDTVVMVNTLSHCQDAMKVFSWIKAHLKKGGSLVFGEPARDINPMQLYDAGHPLSFNQSVIDDFLKGYKAMYRSGNYFIGVKK